MTGSTVTVTKTPLTAEMRELASKANNIGTDHMVREVDERREEADGSEERLEDDAYL